MLILKDVYVLNDNCLIFFQYTSFSALFTCPFYHLFINKSKKSQKRKTKKKQKGIRKLRFNIVLDFQNPFLPTPVFDESSVPLKAPPPQKKQKNRKVVFNFSSDEEEDAASAPTSVSMFLAAFFREIYLKWLVFCFFFVLEKKRPQ